MKVLYLNNAYFTVLLFLLTLKRLKQNVQFSDALKCVEFFRHLFVSESETLQKFESRHFLGNIYVALFDHVNSRKVFDLKEGLHLLLELNIIKA